MLCHEPCHGCSTQCSQPLHPAGEAKESDTDGEVRKNPPVLFTPWQVGAPLKKRATDPGKGSKLKETPTNSKQGEEHGKGAKRNS